MDDLDEDYVIMDKVKSFNVVLNKSQPFKMHFKLQPKKKRFQLDYDATKIIQKTTGETDEEMEQPKRRRVPTNIKTNKNKILTSGENIPKLKRGKALNSNLPSKVIKTSPRKLTSVKNVSEISPHKKVSDTALNLLKAEILDEKLEILDKMLSFTHEMKTSDEGSDVTKESVGDVKISNVKSDNVTTPDYKYDSKRKEEEISETSKEKDKSEIKNKSNNVRKSSSVIKSKKDSQEISSEKMISSSPQNMKDNVKKRYSQDDMKITHEKIDTKLNETESMQREEQEISIENDDENEVSERREMEKVTPLAENDVLQSKNDAPSPVKHEYDINSELKDNEQFKSEGEKSEEKDNVLSSSEVDKKPVQQESNELRDKILISDESNENVTPLKTEFEERKSDISHSEDESINRETEEISPRKQEEIIERTLTSGEQSIKPSDEHQIKTSLDEIDQSQTKMKNEKQEITPSYNNEEKVKPQTENYVSAPENFTDNLEQEKPDTLEQVHTETDSDKRLSNENKELNEADKKLLQKTEPKVNLTEPANLDNKEDDVLEKSELIEIAPEQRDKYETNENIRSNKPESKDDFSNEGHKIEENLLQNTQMSNIKSESSDNVEEKIDTEHEEIKTEVQQNNDDNLTLNTEINVSNIKSEHVEAEDSYSQEVNENVPHIKSEPTDDFIDEKDALPVSEFNENIPEIKQELNDDLRMKTETSESFKNVSEQNENDVGKITVKKSLPSEVEVHLEDDSETSEEIETAPNKLGTESDEDSDVISKQGDAESAVKTEPEELISDLDKYEEISSSIQTSEDELEKIISVQEAQIYDIDEHDKITISNESSDDNLSVSDTQFIDGTEMIKSHEETLDSMNVYDDQNEILTDTTASDDDANILQHVEREGEPVTITDHENMDEIMDEISSKDEEEMDVMLNATDVSTTSYDTDTSDMSRELRDFTKQGSISLSDDEIIPSDESYPRDIVRKISVDTPTVMDSIEDIIEQGGKDIDTADEIITSDESYSRDILRKISVDTPTVMDSIEDIIEQGGKDIDSIATPDEIISSDESYSQDILSYENKISVDTPTVMDSIEDIIEQGGNKDTADMNKEFMGTQFRDTTRERDGQQEDKIGHEVVKQESLTEDSSSLLWTIFMTICRYGLQFIFVTGLLVYYYFLACVVYQKQIIIWCIGMLRIAWEIVLEKDKEDLDMRKFLALNVAWFLVGLYIKLLLSMKGYVFAPFFAAYDLVT